MHVFPKAHLRRFRLRATRAYPKEYIELLFGSKSGSRFIIQHLETLKHKATRSILEFDNDHFEDVVAQTIAKTGLEFLGTIHTHTQGLPEPSEMDNVWAIYCEEHVFAINMITKTKSGRPKHALSLWLPQKPLDVVVV